MPIIRPGLACPEDGEIASAKPRSFPPRFEPSHSFLRPKMVHLTAFLTLALSLGFCFAQDEGLFHELSRRQEGEAFIPGSSGSVICAPESTCARWSLQRALGDICCSENCEPDFHSPQTIPTTNTLFLDACPGGSFCLTKGYFCPDVWLQPPVSNLVANPCFRDSILPPVLGRVV